MPAVALAPVFAIIAIIVFAFVFAVASPLLRLLLQQLLLQVLHLRLCLRRRIPLGASQAGYTTNLHYNSALKFSYHGIYAC